MTEAEEAAAKAMVFELVLAKRALIKVWAKELRKSHKIGHAASVSMATNRYVRGIE